MALNSVLMSSSIKCIGGNSCIKESTADGTEAEHSRTFLVQFFALQSTWSPSWLPCRPGGCSSAAWDTGHPQMTALMNLSAPCPVASIRSILLGNKCEWPRPNTLPRSKTHTGSNTHFLRSVLLAASLISIGLTLLVQILFTWPGHPGDRVESARPQEKQQSPCTLEWKTTGFSALGIC